MNHTTDNGLDTSAVDLTDKAKLSLYKKSSNSGISVDILEEVYFRGYTTWNERFGGTPDSFAFDRVNSFISGGFAARLDEDLRTDNPCWKGYKAVGTKKKNGKTVPNCVPVKEDNISTEKRSKNPDDSSNRFVGTDELTQNYRKRTPGQIIKEAVRQIREQSLDDDTVNAIAREANPNDPDSVRAVLHVVNNRMGRKGYADTPRGVMSQTKQFDAWGKGPAKGVTDTHKDMIKNMWSDVVSGKSKDPTGGANEFRTSATTKQSGLDIGGNRFFKTGSYLKGVPPRTEVSSLTPKPSETPLPPQKPDELKQRVIGSIKEAKTAAWQRKEGKNPEGGLNRKGVESYRRENPGSKLQTAVTTEPSKLKKGSKSWKRRKSFCARMSGMPGPMKDDKGRPTRKALSLRKWNC